MGVSVQSSDSPTLSANPLSTSSLHTAHLCPPCVSPFSPTASTTLSTLRSVASARCSSARAPRSSSATSPSCRSTATSRSSRRLTTTARQDRCPAQRSHQQVRCHLAPLQHPSSGHREVGRPPPPVAFVRLHHPYALGRYHGPRGGPSQARCRQGSRFRLLNGSPSRTSLAVRRAGHGSKRGVVQTCRRGRWKETKGALSLS